MKQFNRLLLAGIAAAAMMGAGASLAGDRHSSYNRGGDTSHYSGDSDCNTGCGSTTPTVPTVNVPVPKVQTQFFNVTVPVPNVHVNMLAGERTKKKDSCCTNTETHTETHTETRTEVRERIIERQTTNNVYYGGGGGSSYVIVQAPPSVIGKVNVVEPTPPKPVKGECQGPKGALQSAWRVSPGDIHPGYEGEVFRCDAGFSLVATVGKMVNSHADYTDGFIIECMDHEALRFGRSGMLACAPEERRTAHGASARLAGGPAAEVMIHREDTASNASGMSLEGLVLTGGVGGRVY